MDEKIVVRPPLWLWSAVILFAFVGASLCWMGITSPRHMPVSGMLFFLVIGGMVLVLAAFCALYVSRERIEADAHGIRWRGTFRGWQSATWKEVSDFYDANGPDARQDQSMVLFQDGRKITFNAYLEGFHALRNAIAERTTIIGKTQWETRDLKGSSTPTSATAYKGAIAFMMGCFASLSLCMGWIALWMPVGRMLNARNLEPLDVWGWATLITLELLCLPLLTLSVIGLIALVRTERPRIVHFNQEGFRVEEKGCIPWEARWDEITAIKQLWNGKRIETPQGVFYATTSLNHYRAFNEIMDANLPAHLHRTPEFPPQTQGDTRTFRYIHPVYRAVLLFPLAIGLLAPAVRLLYRVLGMEFKPNQTLTEALTEYGFTGAFVLLGVWGLWRMYASRIEVSDSGITQVGLNGRTQLRWIDIERGRVIGSEIFAWCELSGAGRQVRWWGGLPNGKLLQEELASRLPDIPLEWKESLRRPKTSEAQAIDNDRD